jgi:hypothetical protein
MDKITITRIEYQLVEIYNEIEISIDELEEIISLDDEYEIEDELYTRLRNSGDIIYYAGKGADEWDWDGKLIEFKTPHNENSEYMGSVMLIDDYCISYDMDARIITGDKQTDINDFSRLSEETLSTYIKMKRRMETINNVINYK